MSADLRLLICTVSAGHSKSFAYADKLLDPGNVCAIITQKVSLVCWLRMMPAAAGRPSFDAERPDFTVMALSTPQLEGIATSFVSSMPMTGCCPQMAAGKAFAGVMVRLHDTNASD